ncbi:hypothetical protein Tco_0798513 [Tanacetum coccineum]
MPEDINVPLILERLFLSTAHAKIDVYKRKITLRVGDKKITFKSVNPASSLIKRVYMLSLRERMELDLEARLMGETLVLNRSLDPLNEDYIELNDLNEPLELRRDQGDDLMPTIKEGEVIKEFRTRDEDLDAGIDDYPSYYDHDKKIHIDCAHNLKFSCMIGFEFTHVNFFPLLYINVMSKRFYNSMMKDKMVYKGDNVVGALMSVPIFVGTFFVVTYFLVLENMEDYRDKGMGDVIFGEPFLREVRVKARQFEGMITLYKGPRERNIDEVGGMHIFWNSMLIMEYLVKVSKRHAFWSLNEDILKITILKTNTPYPSRKIRRICACTHQRPRGIKLNTPYPEDQYAVLELWNQYNILEDIKRGPYSKKSPIRRIQYLDTPYRTDFQTL